MTLRTLVESQTTQHRIQFGPFYRRGRMVLSLSLLLHAGFGVGEASAQAPPPLDPQSEAWLELLICTAVGSPVLSATGAPVYVVGGAAVPSSEAVKQQAKAAAVSLGKEAGSRLLGRFLPGPASSVASSAAQASSKAQQVAATAQSVAATAQSVASTAQSVAATTQAVVSTAQTLSQLGDQRQLPVQVVAGSGYSTASLPTALGVDWSRYVPALQASGLDPGRLALCVEEIGLLRLRPALQGVDLAAFAVVPAPFVQQEAHLIGTSYEAIRERKRANRAFRIAAHLIARHEGMYLREGEQLREIADAIQRAEPETAALLVAQAEGLGAS